MVEGVDVVSLSWGGLIACGSEVYAHKFATIQ